MSLPCPTQPLILLLLTPNSFHTDHTGCFSNTHLLQGLYTCSLLHHEHSYPRSRTAHTLTSLGTFMNISHQQGFLWPPTKEQYPTSLHHSLSIFLSFYTIGHIMYLFICCCLPSLEGKPLKAKAFPFLFMAVSPATSTLPGTKQMLNVGPGDCLCLEFNHIIFLFLLFL